MTTETRRRQAHAHRCAYETALGGLLLATTMLVGAGQARAAVYPVVVDNTQDRLAMDLVIPANATTAGMWGPVVQWPLIGLHLSLLPTGEVLSYGGNGLNGGTQDGRILDIWDPRFGVLFPNHVQVGNAAGVDSFCSTSALLSDGTELVSGGSSYSSNDSSQASSVVNPAALTTAGLASTLAAPRWYASMIKLPDGRDLIAGGGIPYDTGAYADPAGNIANNAISMTPEVFTPGQGWSSLLGASSETAFGPDENRWWYPRQWVAPNGLVFGVTGTQLWYLNPTGNGSVTSVGTFKTTYNESTLPNIGPTSTATMYQPGLILQAGGNGRYNGEPSTSSPYASVINVQTAGRATYADTAPMTYPRQWANSLVLPNGQVLVTGGSTYGDNAGANAVYPAETWNPATGKWTVGASAAIYRGYHSATLLLPDGAVLSSGGGAPGPATNLNAEIYYPPYLFTANPTGGSMLASRATIVSMSANAIGYGGQLNVELGSAATIAKVALLRLGIVTHSFNSGQAYYSAGFTQNGNLLGVAMPPSGNVAPPGYYQVVVIDGSGVPSRGAIFALGNGIAAPAAPPAIATSQPAPYNNQTATAIKVAAGEDGSIAYVTQNNLAYLKVSASATAQQLPGTVKDIAIVNKNSLYAIGMDDNVYHWQNTNAWTLVGYNAATIAASADGGIIIVNKFNHVMFLKPTDDNIQDWYGLPGLAKRAALSTKINAWMIGLDSNVYHWTGNGWVEAGYNAAAISANSKGVAVLNNYNGAIWVKNLPGNDSDVGYSFVSGSGNELAWQGGTSLWLIGLNGHLANR